MINAADKIEVRQATTADEPLIIESWKAAYEQEFDYKYPERWNWMFKTNPFLRDRPKGLPIWIAKINDKVVAWNGAMEINIELNNRQYPAAFSVDTYTLPEYRGRNLALYLEERIQNNYSIYLSIDMAPAVRAILYKLGEKRGKPLSVYLKLVKRFDQKKLYKSFVAGVQAHSGKASANLLNLLGHFGLESLFSYAISELFKRRQKANCSSANAVNRLTAEISFETVEAFGPEADSLWAEVGKAYSCAVPRNSVYLNWKYIQQPHLDYRKFLIKRSKDVFGLFVYRIGGQPDSRIGIICEFILANNDPLLHKETFTLAEQALIKCGAHIIKCGASTSVLADTLASSGFAKIRTMVPMIHISEDTKPNIDYTDLRNRKWLMSLGDHDMDQIFLQDQPLCADIFNIFRNKIPGDKDLASEIL